jgi:hypothetical protein
MARLLVRMIERRSGVHGGAALEITACLLFPPPLKGGVNRHGVAVSQTEFPFQPRNDSTGFDTRLQQALFLGELLELLGRLACLGFDVVYVSLE